METKRADTMNFKNINRIVSATLFFSVASVYSIFAREKRNRKIIACAPTFMNGNVKAIYDFMIKDQRFNDCDIYWGAHNKDELKKLRKDGINAFLDRDILQIPRFFKTGVWITDHGAADIPLYWLFKWKILSIKKVKGNSVWIDTFHGIVFKFWGSEAGERMWFYDIQIVSSDYMKSIYQNSYGFKEEQLFVTGYPRLDLLFNYNYETIKNEVLKDLNLKGFEKYILYAPTWGDQVTYQSLFGSDNDTEFILELERLCKSKNACLLIRTHPNWHYEQSFEDIFNNVENIKYVPLKSYEDTQKLLILSDILITDWSSIFLDYIVLDRPMLFIEKEPPLKNGTPLYTVEPEERPGRVVTNIVELLDGTESCIDDPYKYLEGYSNLIQSLKLKAHGDSKGEASKRCSDIIHEFITKS